MFVQGSVILATLLCNFQSNEAIDYNLSSTNWLSNNITLPVNSHSINPPNVKVNDLKAETTIAAQWHDLEILAAKFAVKAIYENVLPSINWLVQRTNVSSDCQSAIYSVLREATNLKKYAVQMLDSSGKFPPSGILEGTLTDLGRFDECLDIDVMLDKDDDLVSTGMRGQYCSVLIRPPLPPQPRFHTFCNQIPSLVATSSDDSAFRWIGQNAQYFYYTPIRIGLCSPSQCSVQDIQSMVSTMAAKFNLTADVLNMKCSTLSETRAVNSRQLLCLLAFALVFLLVLSGTCIDVFGIGDVGKPFRYPNLKGLKLDLRQISFVGDLKSKPIDVAPNEIYWVKSKGEPACDYGSTSSQLAIDCSQWVITMRCFSIRKNGAAILNLEDGSSGGSLAVIHGLRVITMAWIILGHTYGLVNPQIHSRVFSAKELYTNFLFQGLLNATLSVDMFFFISGLLTIYTFWRRISDCKEGTFPWFSLTVMRYLRLTPAYAAVIAVAVVFPLLSSGPLWSETIDAVAEPCYESWWANLLYVNNFVKTEKLCLMHSWYLSNDMQFHVFAVLFILLLMRSKTVAFLFMAAVMIACTAVSAIQTFVNEYPPTIISTSPVVEDRWKFILDHYYKPWPHLPSYCIGLGVGFMLATKTRIPLSSTQSRVVWLLVSLLAFVVLYGVYPWNMGWQIGAGITAFYSSTFRTLWTACCAWATIALLTTESKGLLAHMLSWNGFLPVSRLTYMAFLVHPFVIWYYSGTTRERFTPSHFNYFHLFLGHYLLTYLLSFALGLFFESPFLALQKLLFSGKQSDTASTKMPTASVHPPPSASADTLSLSHGSIATITTSGEQENTLSEGQTDVLEKKDSFVYHVRNNCGSQASIVYVNTV